MKVKETFLSLQGEGIYTGVPTVFIRFAGCNLTKHCTYCDTVYAQDSRSGEELSVEEVVNRTKGLAPYYKQWVCITGGEPREISRWFEERRLLGNYRNQRLI